MAADQLEYSAQTGRQLYAVAGMVTTYDRLTDELQRSCVRLRDELIFTPQSYGTETFFHIEIPSAARFFRIASHEYVFVSLLDGETTVAQALAISAQRLGPQAVSEDQAARIVHWLLENSMASPRDPNLMRDTRPHDPGRTTWLKKLNPFWLKVPLGNPNRMFELMEPAVRWIFHPLVLSVILLTIVVAAIMAITNAEQIFDSANGILAPGNWMWILATWIALKIVHELAHGLTCRHFGATVKETGIIFVLFAPLAFVDVTSSWRIQSRWRRIAIAGAGIVVELLIAALCVFAWYGADSDLVKQLLVNVILMASVSTVAFNANPLMRFDGYFVLSDLLQIPNLYSAGTKSVQQQLRWLFFGQRIDRSCCEIRNHKCLIACYGICTAIWRIFICVGLVIAASALFGGLGVLLSAFGLVSWFVRPTMSIVAELAQRRISSPHSLVRSGFVGSAIILLVACCWFWIPNPMASRSPCLVDYQDDSKVRSRSSGFVKAIFVENGQAVAAGTPLLQLENLELTAHVAELVARLESERTLERVALDEQQPGAAQIAAHNLRATEKILQEKKRELDGLLISAPINGQVVARNLHQLVGKHVTLGEMVLTIGNETGKEIILSISPEDVDSTHRLVGATIPVEIGSRRRIFARIKRIEPRASTHVTHPGLIAPHGGPLAVREIENDRGREDQNYEFCDSRFHAIATIDRVAAHSLSVGERGHALLDSNSNTLGKWIVSAARRWITEQFKT